MLRRGLKMTREHNWKYESALKYDVTMNGFPKFEDIGKTKISLIAPYK